MNSDEKTQLKLMFDLLDKDCDGKITGTDLTEVNGTIGGLLDQNEISEMLKAHSDGIDFPAFMEKFSSIWENFDDVNDVKDGFHTLSGKGDVAFDAKIMRSAVAQSKEASETAEKFIKANKITGEETFQGMEFLNVIKK